MFAAYVTVLGAVFNGVAAVTYLIGHEYPKTQADMKGLPRTWVPVLAMLAGLAVPLLGTLAPHGSGRPARSGAVEYLFSGQSPGRSSARDMPVLRCW
ncbi:hypothetical protein OG322_15255 [Streptomyces sp. NBC_01260]|uniref:hypothetical protein n=1 Tax=unclassified Streptomyces TaxID=2593676 RepID=UPI00224CD028|nr:MULTISPECIES: hypothetical protein [unclassified Streptomyces]MCX4770716.1 hypothetical protein [Streptomyces sp. NBC_01285]